MRRVEPVIGWRLWWARGGALRSWVADAAWQPGTNVACCLIQGRAPLHQAPGRGCHCGFWATRRPGTCLRLADETWDGHPPLSRGRGVLGLIAAWGTLAVHGSEGFRAARARPLLLFDDVVGLGTLRPMRRLYRGRAATLRRVRERYGVPVVSLAAAVRHGVLAELGVDGDAIEEAWLLTRREGPRYPAGLQGGEPARR
jgi:hypothetical protein